MNTSATLSSTSEDVVSVVLRGTACGLEIVVDPEATAERIAADLEGRLQQSPGFFAGSDVKVRCPSPLPPGTLGRLEAIADRFGLRIAELGPAVGRRLREAGPVELPEPDDEDGIDIVESSPEEDEASLVAVDEPAPEKEPGPDEASAREEPPAPHMIAGPIRSGTVVDVPGHLVVVGDVNPGAEVRAGGNVVVLGALRGVAHAATAGSGGFIWALRLAPHQLRIGELIARAGDAADAGQAPEIAFVADGRIVVESYRGKPPPIQGG